MPKFMWVVRDFSLQLIDDAGNAIDSQQYLERALADYHLTNPGDRSARFNKEMEERNEIKQVLRRFFRERDCQCVVRPVVEESQLQSLEKLNIEDLRSEFVEQVFKMRKKIINAMRPKTINKHAIDGSMWIELAEQYVNAINDGTIPSVESSWTYIQKQRARQFYDNLQAGAFEEAVKADLP